MSRTIVRFSPVVQHELSLFSLLLVSTSPSHFLILLDTRNFRICVLSATERRFHRSRIAITLNADTVQVREGEGGRKEWRRRISWSSRRYEDLRDWHMLRKTSETRISLTLSFSLEFSSFPSHSFDVLLPSWILRHIHCAKEREVSLYLPILSFRVVVVVVSSPFSSPRSSAGGVPRMFPGSFVPAKAPATRVRSRASGTHLARSSVFKSETKGYYAISPVLSRVYRQLYTAV